MAKNLFATLGIFVLLLVSLTIVSAAVEGVSIVVNDDITNPVIPGNSYDVSVNVTNNNGTVILLEWTNTSSVYNTVWTSLEDNSTLEDGISGEYTATLYIPSDYVDSHGRQLRATVYDNATGVILGTILKEFTVNSSVETVTDITGCMDSAANNYNADATIAGTCTYDTVSSETICEIDYNGEVGKLEISDFDITNDGEGSDDEWNYMDAISIEVEIENTDNDDDISDVEVQITILNEDNEDVTDDFDFDEDVIDSIGKLKDNDEEIVIFVIGELPSDIDAGDYKLYIVAYSDGDEDIQCVSEYDDFEDDLYFEFSVNEVDYEDAIVVKESALEDIDTTCGQSNVKITIPVYNLYTEDEESILVNIYNSELGIDDYEVIDDLNDGSKEEVEFYVSIPQELTKDSYKVEILVYFDWDDDEDEMKETSYDEETSSRIYVNIVGCVAKTVAPSMKPTLESVTEEGVELIVKTMITNNGESGDFKISATGYESWASLISVQPETYYINEGEFVEATVVLMPTVSGMHSFKISTIVNDEVFNQPVSLNIKESPTTLGLEGTTLYLVAGIGAILLLILIILIAKVSKKKPAKANF